MRASRREFLRSSIAVGAGLGLGAGRVVVAGEDDRRGKTDTPRKILILGGTGFLGPQIVEEAVRRGHTLTLFNRGRTRPGLFPDIEKLRGDRDGDLKSLHGRKWDAVVDTSGYVPRIVKDSAELLAPNVGHYIFVSTCSVYADNSKPGEDESAAVGTLDDPKTEKITGESYGPLKALCEKAAEAAMPGRVANVRPGLIVGPDDPSDRFTYWPVRVARGGEVLAPGSPDDPVQFIDARDLGAWLVRLVEDRTTGVFNAMGPEKPLGMGAMLDACKAASGSDARFTWADADFLAKQKVSPWSDMPVWVPSAGDSAGFARRSNTKAIRAGLTFRPVVETARDTLAWWKTLPESRRAKLQAGLTPEREAMVLAAWKEKGGKG
jgi:2'-hydroxyisoflavone reductase